jgi:hypothetical protein
MAVAQFLFQENRRDAGSTNQTTNQFHPISSCSGTGVPPVCQTANLIQRDSARKAVALRGELLILFACLGFAIQAAHQRQIPAA